MGRITPLARLSVRPSDCLSVSYGLVTQKQNKTFYRRIKIRINFSQVMNKWSADFQLKTWKVKVTGRQKPEDIAAYLAYMFI